MLGSVTLKRTALICLGIYLVYFCFLKFHYHSEIEDHGRFWTNEVFEELEREQLRQFSAFYETEIPYIDFRGTTLDDAISEVLELVNHGRGEAERWDIKIISPPPETAPTVETSNSFGIEKIPAISIELSNENGYSTLKWLLLFSRYTYTLDESQPRTLVMFPKGSKGHENQVNARFKLNHIPTMKFKGLPPYEIGKDLGLLSDVWYDPKKETVFAKGRFDEVKFDYFMLHNSCESGFYTPEKRSIWQRIQFWFTM